VSDAVLPFHSGGKEQRIDHIAKALVTRGHAVHIYTMKWWPGRRKTYQHAGITYHAISRLYPLYHGKRRSFLEGIMFGLACLKLLWVDYDVLEVDHMPYFPLFSAKLVSLIRRKPFFATWHETVGLQAWRHYIGYSAGTVAYVLERLSVKLPNHIIAVSDRTFAQTRTLLHYTGPMTLVSNGIDFGAIVKAPLAKQHSDVMYTGRLVRHKHVDVLIQAIAKLKTTQPRIKAVIIGDGPERQRLEGLVHELGLEANVTLAGRIEDSNDVFAQMKSSKVFVSPSTREGFGITVLEAYACGLDVVTVNHPDNAAQFLVREGAGLVCELSADAIAASIAQLLKVKRADKATVDASVFDWEKSVQTLQEAYEL